MNGYSVLIGLFHNVLDLIIELLITVGASLDTVKYYSGISIYCKTKKGVSKFVQSITLDDLLLGSCVLLYVLLVIGITLFCAYYFSSSFIAFNVSCAFAIPGYVMYCLMKWKIKQSIEEETKPQSTSTIRKRSIE